jgi:thiamine biosynthesis lipoprotein ApbE
MKNITIFIATMIYSSLFFAMMPSKEEREKYKELNKDAVWMLKSIDNYKNYIPSKEKKLNKNINKRIKKISNYTNIKILQKNTNDVKIINDNFEYEMGKLEPLFMATFRHTQIANNYAKIDRKNKKRNLPSKEAKNKKIKHDN